MVHEVHQGEGCEQGDALSPALFCLCLLRALRMAGTELLPHEILLAYLDDVYAVTSRDRARELFDILSRHVFVESGIRTHLGKTQCWSKAGGVAPEGIDHLDTPGDDPVWKGDLPDDKNGIIILGAPLGKPEFVRAQGAKRMDEERRFLDVLPTLPDLQCAWLLLYFCAVPRAIHMLRSVPPEQVLEYAAEHDEAIWRTVVLLLGVVQSVANTSHFIGQLPCRLGGLGLRSAVRTAPAAYWSAWADALPVLARRFPEVARRYQALSDSEADMIPDCLSAVSDARRALHEIGFPLPSFLEILAGARPPVPPGGIEADPGEWRHGWQFYTSDALELHFRSEILMPQLDPASQALLRSQSGRQAGRAFTALPSDATTTLAADRFRVALCRRLRLPIVLAARLCEGCGQALDCYGDHYSSCMRSGRVQARARPLERIWERVLKEAGATTYFQKLLRETTLPVNPTDLRRIDVLAMGLPCFYGRAIFCDVTVRSPLSAAGAPHGRAATEDGYVLGRALQDKQRTYDDIVVHSATELQVLAAEIGGRWNRSALSFVSILSRYKVSNVAPLLKRSAQLAWESRWWSMLGCGVQDALAASLLAAGGPSLALDAAADSAPELGELLDAQRWSLEGMGEA